MAGTGPTDEFATRLKNLFYTPAAALISDIKSHKEHNPFVPVHGFMHTLFFETGPYIYKTDRHDPLVQPHLAKLNSKLPGIADGIWKAFLSSKSWFQEKSLCTDVATAVGDLQHDFGLFAAFVAGRLVDAEPSPDTASKKQEVVDTLGLTRLEFERGSCVDGVPHDA
ncbi:hypothetical protein RJ55_01599 [Drechmeria coniospora]|nr:hypothetical protein RJ55_01599 [Drechmeria coniospora]